MELIMAQGLGRLGGGTWRMLIDNAVNVMQAYSLPNYYCTESPCIACMICV